MSYVEKHLAPDEKIGFRTRLHPMVFGSSAFFAACVLGIAGLVVTRNALPPETVRLLWLAAVVIAIGSLASPWLRWFTSEFVVTDRRILVRIGILAVHTLELALSKVEAIDVDPSLPGRLLGYGTLRIVGTGGIVEEFERVARPEGLREAFVRQTPKSKSPAARAR